MPSACHKHTFFSAQGDDTNNHDEILRKKHTWRYTLGNALTAANLNRRDCNTDTMGHMLELLSLFILNKVFFGTGS